MPFIINTMLTHNDQILDYEAAHSDLKGPGDARPTAFQILQHEGLLTLPNRLTDRTVLITGGTSGLGLEIAKTLYLTGAKVFITGRCDIAKGENVAAAINSSASNKTLHPIGFVHMDLSDLDSVKAGSESFQQQSEGKLNLLICNAGVMSPQERQSTKQGHEMQFGVNYLAHFLLIRELTQHLLASTTEHLHSRVVVVSSCAHRNCGIFPNNDYNCREAKYNPDMSYGQSKTADIYLANEIERRFGSMGLHGLSVHPGIIMETGITRHMTDNYEELERQITQSMPDFQKWAKNSGQGAGCILWAAVAAKLEGVGGLFLEDCNIARPVKEGVAWFEGGRATWAYDEAAERQLWTDSERLIESWL